LLTVDQDLHGPLLNLAPYILDLSFGHHVTPTHEHNLIRDHIDLVQHVAGYKHMAALGRIASKEVDCLGSDQRIKAVQGFIED
jgi:hypothetical protein